MADKATAILQGRTGSTRLPGKVLLPLAGKPVMQHVYERVLHCQRVDRIIIATSDASQDDTIAELFEGLNVPVFRGSESDPLDRYYKAAMHYQVEHVVRVMADCPLLDPDIVDGVIETYFEGAYDFCCLTGEFPTGLDMTVYSFSALAQSWREAEKKSEREHIQLYITNNPDQFKIGVFEKYKGLLHHRWVMDHEADYCFMEAVYSALYEPGKLFTTGDILALLEKQPHLAEINGGIPRDEGVRKAVEEDK